MKFKKGDKVRNIINGAIGKITYVEEEEEVDKERGYYNNCYYVDYNNGHGYYNSIVEIKKIEEILDKKEKEYLSNVIKPFKKRIKSIYKSLSLNGCEYIEINIESFNTFDTESISLPDFKKGTMYKNMEINKNYTLKDLNLN